MLNWGNVVTVAVIAALLALTFLVGPTDAFIGTYRATGSQTAAGIANGLLRATSWPFALAGYRFDSRDDGDLLHCLHDAGLDPRLLAHEYQPREPALLACARRYDDSHIDLSNATQAQFPVRLGPDPLHADAMELYFSNRSSNEVMLGADVLFHAGGAIRSEHVTMVAFPGQYVTVEAPPGLADGTPDYASVPTVARITDAAAYRPAP